MPRSANGCGAKTWAGVRSGESKVTASPMTAPHCANADCCASLELPLGLCSLLSLRGQGAATDARQQQIKHLGALKESPQDSLTQGALAYQTVVLEDDYVTAEAPSYYFPLYTSLKGFGTAGVRDPTGHVGEAAGSTGVAFPTISLTYPEAEVLPGRLLLNGSPFLAVAEGRLVIQPLQADTQISLPALAGNLQLDFGPSIRVGYHVELYEDTACSALVRNWDVVSAQGVAIQELLHEDATTAIVTPIYDDGAIQTYIRAIFAPADNQLEGAFHFIIIDLGPGHRQNAVRAS